MKHSRIAACITRWEGKGALYIVAHTLYQNYRGRKSSESYKGEFNPRKALLLALAELRTFEPHCGSYIPASIAKMVGIAKFTKQEVSGTFNGVVVTANPQSSPTDLVVYWREETDRKSREYRQTPEYTASLLRRAMQVGALRDKVHSAMLQLETLNFKNIEAVVNWFDELQEASDDVDVLNMVPREEIVQKFQEHGFQPNANVGNEFNEEDKDNFARYIIGQALGCFAIGYSIHPMYKEFAKDWRDKFPSTTAGTETIN